MQAAHVLAAICDLSGFRPGEVTPPETPVPTPLLGSHGTVITASLRSAPLCCPAQKAALDTPSGDPSLESHSLSPHGNTLLKPSSAGRAARITGNTAEPLGSVAASAASGEVSLGPAAVLADGSGPDWPASFTHLLGCHAHRWKKRFRGVAAPIDSTGATGSAIGALPHPDASAGVQPARGDDVEMRGLAHRRVESPDGDGRSAQEAVKSLASDGRPTPEPVKLSEVAVLYRQRKSGRALQALFLRAELPFNQHGTAPHRRGAEHFHI